MPDSPLTDLTNRELEVFQLIGKGKTTRETAQELHLSVKTIETYREHIKQKLVLKNANELVRYAVEMSKTLTDPNSTDRK